jgi:hypothetical protein
MILLPNRELMQANFLPAPDNSFCWQVKQEWEWRGFQNGTSLENGWLRIHVRRSINCPGLHLRGRFPSEVVQGSPHGPRWNRAIPPCTTPRSRMPRKSPRAQLTEPLPQKNRRPESQGHGPRSGRNRKKQIGRRYAWRRQTRHRSRRSFEQAWRADPKPLAAMFSLYPMKCRDHYGQ